MANEITITSGTDLPVSMDAAFTLITDPAALRQWFAEDVSLEPVLGGRFVFAGLGSYAPTATILTKFDVGTSMGWSWLVHGEEGQVTLTLTPKDEPDECHIDATCIFQSLPNLVRARELIDDLWRFYMGNLKTLAEGNGGTVLPDFSDPTPQVKQSIFIAAPRERVFRALLDPVLLKKWTWGNATVDAKVGGEYRYGWEYEMDGKKVLGGPTRILELVENERLVSDWPDWRGGETNNTQKITWLLEDDGDGTLLTLVHDGFVRASDISDFPFGWAGFLEGIRDVAQED
jgi:uncharacterized protein YndB with AHSA1/START domain